MCYQIFEFECGHITGRMYPTIYPIPDERNKCPLKPQEKQKEEEEQETWCLECNRKNGNYDQTKIKNRKWFCDRDNPIPLYVIIDGKKQQI